MQIKNGGKNMARKMISMDGNTAAAHVCVCVYGGCRNLSHHALKPYG